MCYERNSTTIYIVSDTTHASASMQVIQAIMADRQKFLAERHLSLRILGQSQNAIFTDQTCKWRPIGGDPMRIS